MRKSPYRKMTLGAVGLGLVMNPFSAQANWWPSKADESAGSINHSTQSQVVPPSDKKAESASFFERHSWLTFGAKCAGGVAATAALSTFGVPIWLASPLVMNSPQLVQSIMNGKLAKDTVSTFMTDGMVEGVKKATRWWVPQALESTVGKVAAAVATPVVSLMACKAMVDAGVSAAKTAYSYAKESPFKAALGASVATVAVYYGAPLIKEALVRMGDGALSTTRVVIDHGSGAIKGSYVRYNPFTEKILPVIDTKTGQPMVDAAGKVVEMLQFQSKSVVSLTATMEKGVDRLTRLNEKTMAEGIEAINDIVQKAKEAGVSEVNMTGAATAWARSGAVNIQEYIDTVKAQTGVQLNILTQVDEGQFGRIAAASHGVDTAHEVVLDTGGGSLQLTKGPTVYGTETASVTFAKHIEQTVGKPLKSFTWTKGLFDRLSEESKIKTLAENTAKTGNVLEALKKSIENNGGKVKGIGGVYNAMLKFVKLLSPQTTQLTAADLDYAMKSFENMSMEEASALVEKSGIHKKFAGTVVTNLPLVSGIMKAFDIKALDVLDAESGMGAYFYEPIWQDAATNATVKAVQDVSNVVLGARKSQRAATKRQ